MGGRMWIADFLGGIVVFLLGVALIFFSRQLSYTSEYGPGPGFLPLWLGIGLVGCALFVILKNLKKHAKAAPFFRPRTKLSVKMLVMIIITFILFPVLGFSTGLALFAGITMRIMGKHSLILCGISAVLTAVGIHFIFGQLLYIPLPTGMIGW